MTKKYKILLIEDELQWANFLTYSIGKKFDVITVTDIEKVVSILDEELHIDAVLMDITMSFGNKIKTPKSGLYLFQYLKENRPDIPIIGYTGYHISNDDVWTKQLGLRMLIQRSDMGSFEYLINSINNVIQESNPQSLEIKRNKKSYDEFKELLNNEIAKFSEIKDKTLSIPQEGNFDLIKPLIGFKKDIENQIVKYDYRKNVFLMMKFRPENKDLSDYIIETLRINGLNGIRADQNEWNITRNVYNPIAALYCCKFGIALFDEPENHQAYSPNVAYELGIMHYQNKNCLILKHNSLPTMPFDLIKDLYVQYDKDLKLKRIISDWIDQIK